MKKIRQSCLDFRTLFLFSFLALTACSTGLDVGEEGEGEESELPAETAQTSSPTDSVPEEIADVEAPPPEAPPAQESPPAPVEQQVVADAAPAAAPAPVEALPPNPQEPTPVAAVEPAPAPVVPEPVISEPVVPEPVMSEPVAQTAPEPSSLGGETYTFQKGDTLMKVSWEQYGTLFRWREIYQFNKSRISDPNHVPPGTRIQLPSEGRNPAAAAEHNGEQYLIVSGDTLGKISNKVYGTIQKWKALWENNRQLIRDPNRIYAGFFLYYIPESKMSSIEGSDASGSPVEPGSEPTG